MGHGDVIVALVAPRSHEKREVQRAVLDARPDVLAVAGGDFYAESRICGAEFAYRLRHRREGDGFARADRERPDQPLVVVGADFTFNALREADEVFGPAH